MTLYDYERVEGNRGNKRLIAFGKFAGRAAIIDLLKGLGQRMLSPLQSLLKFDGIINHTTCTNFH